MVYIQLCSAYAPAWAFGGVVRTLYGYACYLSSKCETWVLAGDLDERQQKADLAFDAAQPYSIRRYSIASRRLARRNIHTVSLGMLWGLLILMRQSPGPIVVHVSEFRGLPNLYALIAKSIFGRRIKIVHSAFGGLHEKRSMVRRIYDGVFTGPFLRAIDLALAENAHEADEYRKLMSIFSAHANHHRIAILPLQVEDISAQSQNWFENGSKSQATQRATRRRLGLREDALIFCFLGRFHPQKGILRTIDLFCSYKARAHDDNVELLIIGRDEGFEGQIRRHASESAFPQHIRIITDIYAERFEYFYASDVFIGVPTMIEETMLSSLEALSCGTPVLLSREADAPYVEEDGAGRIIEFELDEAVEALEGIVNRHAIFAAQALLTAEKFSSMRVLSGLETALTAVAEGRPFPPAGTESSRSVDPDSAKGSPACGASTGRPDPVGVG